MGGGGGARKGKLPPQGPEEQTITLTSFMSYTVARPPPPPHPHPQPNPRYSTGC